MAEVGDRVVGSESRGVRETGFLVSLFCVWWRQKIQHGCFGVLAEG